MISLIASFFIISPLLILYTTGYRYDWRNHVFLTTGVLSIEGDPRDMDVFINDIQIEKTVPIRLTNLTPNTYRVRLEKAGYITWEKDVTVESNKTSYIKHIGLIRKTEPVALPSVQRFTSFALSYDGAHMLGMTQSTTNTFALSLFNAETKKETPLSIITASTSPYMEWSPYDASALISWKDVAGQHIRLVSGERAGETDAIALPGESVIRTQWDSSESLHLFFADRDEIFSLTSDGANFLVRLPVASAPWYIDGSRHLWTYDADRGAVTETVDGNVKESYATDQPIDRFVHVNNKRIVAHHENMIDIVERTSPPRVQRIQAESVTFNSGTHEWIVWSPWELWTIYEDGNATLLNRTGDPIQFVRPLDDFGVLLVATQNSLTAFNPGYYVTQKILDVSNIREVRVHQKQRKILFTKTSEGTEELFELNY